MSKVLMSTFDQCPNLMSELRVLEMFQGVSRREVVQVNIPQCQYCELKCVCVILITTRMHTKLVLLLSLSSLVTQIICTGITKT